MRFTFDPAKNEKNIVERGLSFALAAELDWEAAFIVEDTVAATDGHKRHPSVMIGQA